ncbi:recombinase family protein [uncultured Vagococcus sp.]|uniref:recombinase family protein n=1 Tax=uncultured Vagococcus sp. TaxID=189676 RepID=UPI0028D3E752|nr:recombinase family protein [uncultured Vagococcus sp.]
MKIGYTVFNPDPSDLIRLYEEGKCEKVEVVKSNGDRTNEFLSFLKENKGNEIVVTNIEALHISLRAYSQIEALLQLYESQLIFLDKEMESDDKYLSLLSKLAMIEKTIIGSRTREGLRKAQKTGKIVGRPRIEAEKINRIQFLYREQKKTIREIVSICDVSIGTVHKYK